MALGNRISALLEQARMSPAQLARAINVNEQTFYGILKRDNRKTSVDILVALCSYFKVDISYFLDEESDAPVFPPPLPADMALLNSFHNLNEEGQKRVVDYTEDLDRGGRFKIGQPEEIPFEAEIKPFIPRIVTAARDGKSAVSNDSEQANRLLGLAQEQDRPALP